MAYGLRPVKSLNGAPQTGGFQEFNIADAYGTSIFNGDCVEFSGGNLIISTGVPQGDDSADATVGVFVGCRYTDSGGQTQFSNFYLASAGITDVFGYVRVPTSSDLFQVQGTVLYDVSDIGEQVQLATGTGSTASGNSGWTVTNGTSDAAGGVFVVGVTDNENKNTATPDLIVRFAHLAVWFNS